MDGEGEAEDGDRAGLLRRAARDAGAGRTPADDQRQPGELAGAQMFHDHEPGRVQLGRRRGRAPARDAVGLLDERDRYVLLQRNLGGDRQVGSGDAAAGTVTEHERGPRLGRRMEMHACRAVWSFDLSCHGFA
jgi:hypothetical protein